MKPKVKEFRNARLLLDKKYTRCVTSWRLVAPIMPKHENTNSLELKMIALAVMCRDHARDLNKTLIKKDIMSKFRLSFNTIKHGTSKLSGIYGTLATYARKYELV